MTSEAGSPNEIDNRSLKIEATYLGFSWLYYSPVEQNFKCKMKKLLQTIGLSQAKFKFGQIALKDLVPLVDVHFKYMLNHKNSWKQSRNIEVIMFLCLKRNYYVIINDKLMMKVFCKT